MFVSRAQGRRGFWASLVAAGLALLCVSPLAAQTQPAGTVAAAAGQVSVLRHGEMWALSSGHSVRVGEMIVTGPDGMVSLEITDGTTFAVYPNSRVVFRSNPGNWRELVEVFLGRVKVHIQSFGGRPNPYRVHSPTAVISVRGTVFEVAVDSDSVTWIGVDEGAVSVEHRLLPGKAVSLSAGESLQVFPNSTLAAARTNKLGLAARTAEVFRDLLYVIHRVGNRPSGAGGGGLPGDKGAPPSPPPPADREAPPPPPPPPGGNP